MALRKDVRELLSQIPGRYPHLQAVRFLKDPESFYRVIPKTEAEVEQDVAALLAKDPTRYTRRTAYQAVPKTKALPVRPEWMGPEPTIKRLSEVPVALSDAYEVALGQELLVVYWDPDGDAHIYLSAKGLAALTVEHQAVGAKESRRPCYDRDHTWLHWSEKEGMGPAAIRDKWNKEHPEGQIGKGESGRDTVKKGLERARAEREKDRDGQQTD